MERGHSTPRESTAVLDASPTFSRTDNKHSKNREFINDLSILNDSLTVGRDYLEATGKYPEFNNFQALYFNGYTGYEPREVQRIFGDWETFQLDINVSFSDYQNELESQKSAILEIIELDSRLGAIHPLLLKKSESVKAADKVTRANSIQVFTEEDADDDTKIERYVKFKIAERMTPNLESAFEESKNTKLDPLTRRTNIALGFNINTGLALSSYKGELRKSLSGVSFKDIESRIEEIALLNGWQEFIHKESRGVHLEHLVLAAESWGEYPLPEKSYFDLRKIKLLGKAALTLSAENVNEDSGIVPLSLLLTDKEWGEYSSSAKPYQYKNRTLDDDIKYGQWLRGLASMESKDLTEVILRRANQLNLGPSPQYLAKRFGSLANFYKEIGMPEKKRLPDFSAWDDDQIVAHVRAVMDENSGKISARILSTRIKEGRDEPSPRCLQSRFGTLSKLYLMARKSELRYYPTPEESLYDKQSARLLGRIAVKEYLSTDELPSHIIPVRDALLDPDLDIQSTNWHMYREWTREKCVRYGQWLVENLNHGEGGPNLTEITLARAARLGLGPGPTLIAARFGGNILNYYKKLEIPKKNQKGAFDKMTREDAIEFIRTVASLNAGRVSESILHDHYLKSREMGISVPSPRILSRFCNEKLGVLIEDAGFTVSIRSQPREQILASGIRFYNENGRLPTTGEISSTEYFPHWASVSKKFGKIGDFHTSILEALNNTSAEEKIAA